MLLLYEKAESTLIIALRIKVSIVKPSANSEIQTYKATI